MSTRKTYKSDAFAAIHEAAFDLLDAEGISPRTMREFDELCLTPIEEFTPQAIKALREREDVSQPVFARYLNVTKGLVSQWERGEKHPKGTSLKLLNLVRAKGLRAIA